MTLGRAFFTRRSSKRRSLKTVISGVSLLWPIILSLPLVLSIALNLVVRYGRTSERDGRTGRRMSNFEF